jgi:alpha-1,3-rhamnosyl/mannosyltransferase
MAERLGESARARLLGRVTDADLEALYSAAEALVFPSLYEGFGIPVLEAMRRGVPVVTAAVSSLPEVAGDAAVYVEDPRDAEALAGAIETALRDGQRLRELGRARAAGFTWDRTAAGVAAAMRELLA